LANNHVLDWGRSGLEDTLSTLSSNGLKHAGAGLSDHDTAEPAIIDLGSKGRIEVFAMGATDSGVPLDWAAGRGKPGVNIVTDVSAAGARAIAEGIRQARRTDSLAVASIHWGSNWGYGISASERGFAHALIDEGFVDVVHGHSSHHPKAIEIYKGRLIIYGCGDFLNDYEGIGGYEEFRSDLVLLYVARLSPRAGVLLTLELVPFRIRRFRLEHAAEEDVAWLLHRLGREYGRFGARLEADASSRILVRWQ
ncbi:MAG TPA: CapA family protein, partial [Alphaproteobacteria bacterium]|nr:CapA family protein [Alphaproteobacteria bacterium]